MKINNQNAKNAKTQTQDRDAIREFRAETSEIAGIKTPSFYASQTYRRFNAVKDLFRTGDWVFIGDYHDDFYQLAADPRLYGYNIECELKVGNQTETTILPWIDIYAGREESADDADGQATNTASGFEGGNQPSGAAESLIVVEAKDGAPKIVFAPAVDERHVNVCYPQTGRLFGKTVRECARAWAEINGFSVPLDRVVVCPNRVLGFFRRFLDVRFTANEFIDLNPELAVEWGLATEGELFPRLAEEARRREEASRIPPIKGVAVASEVLEQLRQNMSPEQFAQTSAWLESTNAAAAQNVENQEDADE
ncbi:MAG: hypothetical protein IKK39_07330 [Thermoguttaceae bacterium]|nr:hypothetical protein [Thermoguttaceae bacterium]MBR4103858.1 hypothetical protein [Thermoguttaceae bacterium]